MYYGGEFIPRNFKKAFEYYQLAMNSDRKETYIRAWCNLGYCYYYGRDIPVDDEKAFNCFLRGMGVERDAAKALEFLTDAEFYTHEKIRRLDPFAATVLPKILGLLEEVRRKIGKQKSGNIHSRNGRQRGGS